MRLALLTVCLSGLLVGCSSDAGSNNTTNNGGNDGGVDAGNPVPDVDNTGVTYAESYSTRVTQLRFAEAPAADLNGIVELNLNQSLDEPIILLVELMDLDADAGSASLKAGSGLKGSSDGTYVYDPASSPTTVPATIDLASGAFEGTFADYHFVATIEFSGEVQKVNIPLHDLTISGTLDLSEDGTTASIPAGKWDGHVTKADGDVTMVVLAGGEPRPLTELFRTETLNYDTTTGMVVAAGTGDAWKIDATFIAEATTVE